MAPLELPGLAGPLATGDGVEPAAWALLCGAAAAASAARTWRERTQPPPPVQTRGPPPLPAPPPPPAGSRPCKKCSGRTKVACFTCQGAGRLNSPTALVPPKGEGVEWCPTCRGTGREVCPWCLGEGFKRDIGFRQ